MDWGDTQNSDGGGTRGRGHYRGRGRPRVSRNHYFEHHNYDNTHYQGQVEESQKDDSQYQNPYPQRGRYNNRGRGAPRGAYRGGQRGNRGGPRGVPRGGLRGGPRGNRGGLIGNRGRYRQEGYQQHHQVSLNELNITSNLCCSYILLFNIELQ